MFYYTINSHSCKQHDVLRKCDVFLSGFSMKQSCFTVFSPFRQSKVITSHWEACAEQVLRPGHPGSLYLRPGSDQQPGDAADQPTLPAQHRTLQPPGLPGSCSLSAGCYYTDCHSSATGQSSTYLLWGLKKKTFMYVATFAVVSVVSPVNLFRCTSTDCCCCSPHLHTFVCLILDAGLQASLGCRLCTTFTSGS